MIHGKRFLLYPLLFLICVATSFFIKTCHYNMEAARVASVIEDAEPLRFRDFRDALPLKRPNFVPYTIESAMMFAYAKDIADGKGVPAHDPRLAYLPDVPPYAQMNMALEWLLGWSYRVKCLVFPPEKPSAGELRFQDNPDFAAFTAWNVRLWTAFIPGLIFLWLVLLRTPPGLAFAGGMLHAVAASAIARATGQDIVRGDLCIPLILLSMVLAHSYYIKANRWKLAALFGSVFLCFIAWDLSQLLFAGWAGFEILRILCGGNSSRKRRNVWLVIYLAIAGNALFIPFNVTYGLIMSPFFCILLPLTLILLFADRVRKTVCSTAAKRFLLFLTALGCLWGFHALFVDNPGYRANYSHFSEAMKAKWKFKNIKPSDPSKLNYDARMMWTPSMHSATWDIAVSFFPSLGSLPFLNSNKAPSLIRQAWNFTPVTLAVLFFIIVIGGLFTPTRKALLRDLPRSALPLLFLIGFLTGFVFIVRYHEFVIIFLALSLPLVIQAMLHGLRTGYRPKNRIALAGRILIITLLVLSLLVELYASLGGRKRAYSADVYLKRTAQLIEWFRREDMNGQTVLANFTIGPMLMAYCGTNLVLQPQFGMEPIRRPVEEYLNILYHKNERSMSGFCSRYGAKYLIYDHGSLGPLHPYSSAYIANAVHISRRSPAYRMRYEPNKLTDFYPVKPPADLESMSVKYTVFRVVTFDDKMEALQYLSLAKRAWRNRDKKAAIAHLKTSLNLDPCSEEARDLFFRFCGRMPSVTLKTVL